MNAQGPDERPSAMHQALEPTPDCIPLERLGEEFSAAERRHLDACARCQAELALWQRFESSSPDPQEGAAVQWIVAELKRRREPVSAARPRRWAAWLSVRGLAAAAATVAVATAVGYLTIDREPALRDVGTVDQQAYRTIQLQVVSPVGDVREAPGELVWTTVAGAMRYDIVVLEVDGTIVWRASSIEPRIPVPRTLASRFVPGKPFVWEVTARDASGIAMASSGRQRFRLLAV